MPFPKGGLLDNLSLAHVLKTIPSGLFVVDRGQRIVHWNEEAERITGYPAEEALGRHCSFLSGIPCGRTCGLFDPSLAKPIIGSSCTVRTREGERITLLKNVDYLRDERGEIVGGIESFIDITRQVQLERKQKRLASSLERQVNRRTAQLEEERSQMRRLLDAMADYAYICAPDRRIVFMNRSMRRTFGEGEGQVCHAVLYGRSGPCQECPLDSVKSGKVVRGESRSASGRTLEIIHSPVAGGDGEVQKLAVLRDITSRKRMEEQLRRANRELDGFVSTLSHDLRSPLSVIIGYADWLREEYLERLDARAAGALEEIESQGQRILALMEDLLILAREGRPEAPAEGVDAYAVARAVREELQPERENTGTTIALGPLPRLTLPSSLLAQIFRNLIGNALRYAPGSPIEIESRQGAGRVRIFVRDHGPGIPPEERERIFSPFVRGSNAGASPGTGIGLAIVHKIAHLYNGRVWLEETPGGGSTFGLEFPVAERRSPKEDI